MIDVCRGQTAAACPDSQPRAAGILALHGEQPLHHGVGRPRGLARQELRGEAVLE
ncbi:MAG TPA: hypothetical protein VK307_13040 [Thermoleophilaceae bacterium]|nr:hypothetical protein [Thermoleophilaceae bacterium]